MAKLIALTNIEHDGKTYAEGAELEVKDEAQVEALIKVKAAEVKGKKPAAEEKPAE